MQPPQRFSTLENQNDDESTINQEYIPKAQPVTAKRDKGQNVFDFYKTCEQYFRKNVVDYPTHFKPERTGSSESRSRLALSTPSKSDIS